MNIGIIGCGNISKAYFEGGQKASNLSVVACADLLPEAALAQAETYGCRACSVDELLADPNIELVVNLTLPQAHVEVGLQAVAAGKHVYSEKPLGLELAEAKSLLDAAAEKGLRVGNAPDTFLFGGSQTARKLVDDGWIGRPIGGIATMMCHGHEHWHPNPGFYYAQGGGPMLDMGPYYLHALVNLIGPIRRVAGFASKGFEERRATSEGAFGQILPVSVPTHYSGSLEFHCGALVSVIMSFDVWSADSPPLQLFGTEGSLQAGDPNVFTESPQLQRERGPWREAPLTHPANARMIGVVDMVQAILDDRPHRASGQNALHALEAMLAFEKSSATGQTVEIATPAERPAPLPLGLPEWSVD